MSYENRKNFKNQSRENVSKKEESEVLPVETTENEIKSNEVKKVKEPEVHTNKKGVVKCKLLNMRSTPGGDVVCEIPANARLDVDSEKSNVDWLYVTTKDGRSGYVMSTFVKVQ